MNDDVADDVAAASAAYLVNLLPALAGEDPSEAFRRLQSHFIACLAAYRDCRPGWRVPEPSDN